MINKKLRILIANKDHEQLLCIEKQLNKFKYYRIAPVRTYDELMLLTSNPYEQFDLLIANKALTLPYGIDLADFCRMRPHIVHTLFYESRPRAFELVIECQASSVNASLVGMPNTRTLAVLMNAIDPPAPRKNLNSLACLS